MIYSHFSHLCLLDFTIFDNRPPSQTFKTDSMSSSSLIGFKTQLAYCINGLCAEYAFHPQLMATSESSHPLLCTANPQPRDACCQNPWSDTLESASCCLCSGCAVMQTKGFLTAPSNCQRQARQAGDCSSGVQDVHSSNTHRSSTGFQTAFAPFLPADFTHF